MICPKSGSIGLVWQKGIELTKDVYQVVKKFPKEETYVLSDQLRRAAISIPFLFPGGCYHPLTYPLDDNIQREQEHTNHQTFYRSLSTEH